MTQYILENFEVVRIFAPVFEINKPFMKVLEKAGYHLEATHKKAVLKNNVIMDEYLYVKMAN
jgi:RimJ/RimL family protein N-acetyltransferase